MIKSPLTSFVASALLLSIGNMVGQSTDPFADQIIGLFWSPNRDAKIRIYKKANLYYGRTVWVAKAGKDLNNPDKNLRTRVLLGLELFSGFAFDQDSYTGGTIYDPESGNTYKCKMTLVGNKLHVRGYIGISLFGRTEIFERTKS